MNKILLILSLSAISCFGDIVNYTSLGGGVSAFSSLTGIPYTITLTNSDGSIILTPITTNVVGNSSNVVVDISDGPNTNALSASQTQIIGRAITNIVAGPGISVTGTNTIGIGSSVVTNPWPNNLTVTGTVSVANSTYPDQLFIVNPVNGIVDIGDAGFDVHKTFIFVNDNTRTVAISATNGTTFYGSTTGSFISVGGNTITNNNLADIVGQGNIIADNNVTANAALQGSELQLYDNSLFVFQNLLALGGNIKFRGANLATNSIAASSSTNLLATDSSGNQVAVPWSSLPSGGGGAANGLYTNVTSGTVASAVNFTNAANSFTGTSSGLTGLNAANMASGNTSPSNNWTGQVILPGTNNANTVSVLGNGGGQWFAGPVPYFAPYQSNNSILDIFTTSNLWTSPTRAWMDIGAQDIRLGVEGYYATLSMDGTACEVGAKSLLGATSVPTIIGAIDHGGTSLGVGINYLPEPTSIFSSIGSANAGTTMGVFENTNTGTSAFSRVFVRNSYNDNSSGLELDYFGTNFTDNGAFQHLSGVVQTESLSTGGLSFVTRAFGAAISFYSGGFVTPAITITSNGIAGNGSGLTNGFQNTTTFTNFLINTFFTNLTTRSEFVSVNARCNPTTIASALFGLVTSPTGATYTTNATGGLESDTIFTTSPHSWNQLTAIVPPGGIWKVVDISGDGAVTITNSFYKTLQ